ncbi:hypothetical protein M408DRAFT_24078 [Serendipita vermifera MAFF 305830]|uniref:Major facilitator superfamily (MFS) profile domain-containing protein n=1 Tax=Serendipita vermifera MAFF 305830 TaxID=933852 RepID=A0A0C3B7E2_SERVB|nr:hypothetical protein M408DRAFT_24078 [Serendipita vermifera MAFF 305830]
MPSAIHYLPRSESQVLDTNIRLKDEKARYHQAGKIQSYDALEMARCVPLPPSSSTIFTQPIAQSSGGSSVDNSSRADVRLNESSLAPVDRGIKAWSFLTAAFLVQTIVLGFPNAYGVILDAYLKDPSFTSQPNAQFILPMIGTLTSGIIYCAGTAAGGAIFPLGIPPLLDRFGTSGTLRVLAIAFVVLLLPALSFIHGRLPHAKTSTTPRRTRDGGGKGLNWMRNASFRFLILINTLQAFGYFVPIVWLPTFASNLNVSVTNSSLTLALLNGASVLGRLIAGVLSDHLDPWLLALSSLMGACLTIFVLWGLLGCSLSRLIAFGLVYGSVAGGWSSMWSGFIRQVARDDPQMVTTMTGYLMLSRGIGNVLSTPISTAVSRPKAGSTTPLKLGFDVGNGKFENVIIYAGTCFAGAVIISGMGWGWDRAKSSQRRR